MGKTIANQISPSKVSGRFEPTTSQNRAREIMGKNLFGIEEANRHFGVNPTKKQLAALAEVTFTEEVLEFHKDTHILIAVFPVSILDIRKANGSLFCSSKGGWHGSEKFAKSRGTARWQLVRKTPIRHSTSKSWNKQQALFSKDEETPSAQVMVYTIIGHYLNTNERLFENIYVRNSSVHSGGCRIAVGGFARIGLVVSDVWGDCSHSSVGVASARKFQ